MVELRVRVDENKIKRFREYVKEKHGKLYAALGLELGKAMDEYLDRRNYEDAHAHIHRTHNHRSERSKKIRFKGKKDNFHPAYANGGELNDRKFPDPKEPGISSSERTKRKIIRYLEESGMMEAASLSENAVRRFIAHYEDINGNGRKDFDDVVYFFKRLAWVEENKPVGCFDFNQNGRIDFDDVVKLFEEI